MELPKAVAMLPIGVSVPSGVTTAWETMLPAL